MTRVGWREVGVRRLRTQRAKQHGAFTNTGVEMSGDDVVIGER